MKKQYIKPEGLRLPMAGVTLLSSSNLTVGGGSTSEQNGRQAGGSSLSFDADL